jgi:hypothetical protein
MIGERNAATGPPFRTAASMDELHCQECSKALEYKGTGRLPLYCSRRCKKRAEQRRARFARIRPPAKQFVPPLSSRVLSEREKEELLGRPLYSGDWAGYLDATGRTLGGFPR